MAKPTKKKESESGEGPNIAKQSRSARKLLIAALGLSVASLGGGFFLARMAYQQDAATYQPDYVEHEVPMGEPFGKAVDEHGDETETTAHGEAEGMLSFNDITTNINGFDVQGRPTRAFLKLSLVLVYLPEPGAKELMEERQPFMRDLFNGYARGLTEADTRGTVGLLNVKSELLKRARAAVGNDLPQQVLINDLIVQ
jgi:flagellar FliL protein